LNIVSLQNHF